MHFSLKAFSTDQMKFGAVISTRCNDLIIRRLCKANNKKSPVFFKIIRFWERGETISLNLARNISIMICCFAVIKLNSRHIIQLDTSWKIK